MKAFLEIISLIVILGILSYLLIMSVVNLHLDIFALSLGLILFLFPQPVSISSQKKNTQHKLQEFISE